MRRCQSKPGRAGCESTFAEGSGSTGLRKDTQVTHCRGTRTRSLRKPRGCGVQTAPAPELRALLTPQRLSLPCMAWICQPEAKMWKFIKQSTALLSYHCHLHAALPSQDRDRGRYRRRDAQKKKCKAKKFSSNGFCWTAP